MTSLDPKAPLVLDTRELGRRPGSQREVELTVPAPAELGIEVLSVPEGSPVDLDLRAIRRQPFNNCPANAAASAGHNGGFACKFACHSLAPVIWRAAI